MKLIKPKAELLLQQPGLEGVYKQIELAGRTCYKSTDKITEDSAKPFVDRMINSNHLAMLEHGTVYLKISIPKKAWFKSVVDKYYGNPHSKVNNTFDDYDYHYFITTNYRVLIENGWLDDLKYMCAPTEYHEKRYTFRLITSIGVTRELNRHRVNSIAEMSTRYCNYSKDKFGNEINVIIPQWCNLIDGNSYDLDIVYNCDITENINLKDKLFLESVCTSENNYMLLLQEGWQPQQAREVLPLCTATEIIHTAFASDWKHFFDLRYFGTTGKPHPNMVELSTLMKEEAEKHGIWDNLHN